MKVEPIWLEPQLSKEQAIAFGKNGEGEGWTAVQVAAFQLFQKRLCIDMCTFQTAVQEVLGRPVWSHEFAYPGALQQEFLAKVSGIPMSEVVQRFSELDPVEKLHEILGPDWHGKVITLEVPDGD